MENDVGTKTSEELTLLLQECHRQVRINERNIQIILQEANARLQRHQLVEKEIANAPDAKQ